MSHSLSPNNRGSIFGWVKNLKKGNLTSNESLNDLLSDNETNSNCSRSPTKPPLVQGQQEYLVPLLHHKSRSTNNVSRVRSNSLTQNERNSIRQHRDSFLQSNSLIDEDSKYFGVSLEEAINQASAKISIFTNENPDNVLQYGRIPIVVAKCGVYLKKNGLNVEGIFRVGGSSKRIKELQMIFNTPPDFGKKLNWDGYTVHDTASVLRRYLNALPEPLIPLHFYEIFREPLRKRQRIIQYLKYKAENPSKVAGKDAATSLDKKNEDNATSSNNEIDKAEEAQKMSAADKMIPQIRQVPDDTPLGPQKSPPSLQKELSNDSSTNFPLTAPNIKISTSEQSSSSVGTPCETLIQGSQTEKSISQELFTDSASDDDGGAKKTKTYTKLKKDIRDAIAEYKELLEKLPILSRQLLFYILDLLAMVQNHSSENLMSSRNLAAIFQPSLLSHPSHDMDPEEYVLSAAVVEFLIHYAYKLLPDNNNSSFKKPLPKKQTPNGDPTKSDTPEKSPSEGDYAAPKFARRHSQSLSSTLVNEDSIGYRNNSQLGLLPTVDSDIGITDDDNSEMDLKLNEAPPVAASVSETNQASKLSSKQQMT